MNVFVSRCLRASAGLVLMKSTAFAHAAAKRFATSGRLLMKSLVSAQPATNALVCHVASPDHSDLKLPTVPNESCKQ